MPATTSSWTVFWLTFFGLFIPITFVEILGALVMTIQNPAYTDAFTNGSAGGLIAQLFSVWGYITLFNLSCADTDIYVQQWRQISSSRAVTFRYQQVRIFIYLCLSTLR